MIAVLASETGALLAWAPTVTELPPAPLVSTVRTFAEWDAPPSAPWAWSPADVAWVIPAQPAAHLSRLAFRSRYTLAEQIGIQRAELEHPDPDVRATLAILRQSLSDAETVDVTDPRTIAAVTYHAQLGLIAPGRAAEILTAP